MSEQPPRLALARKIDSLFAVVPFLSLGVRVFDPKPWGISPSFHAANKLYEDIRITKRRVESLRSMRKRSWVFVHVFDIGYIINIYSIIRELSWTRR